MIDMTEFLDNLEDDMIQEADTSDSLVEEISDNLNEGEEIELAKPMDSLQPIHENDDNDMNNDQTANTTSTELDNPNTSSTQDDTPPAMDDSNETSSDDNQSSDVDFSTFPQPPDISAIVNSDNDDVTDNNQNQSDFSNDFDNQNVPDTTPDPDDKDQGNFDGPMSYIPLYQRRNEDDLTGFGSDYHGDTPDNEYDLNEVNTINELVASEASAMDEYNSAAKKSRLDQLQRLYADIANEERFHLEQLLYAKSLITGEKYIPRDPDVKNEYKELVALGMDEETAMTTAIDKIGLMPPAASAEEVLEYAQEVIESRDYLETLIKNMQMIMEQVDDDGSLKKEASITIQEGYASLAEIDNDIDIFQEAVSNVADGKSVNPFKMLANLIRKLYMAIIGFIKKLKAYIGKFKTFCAKKANWIKAHGIKGLFAEGLNLYFFDEKNTCVDMTNIGSYLQLCIDLTKAISDNCNVDLPVQQIDLIHELGDFRRVKYKSIEEGVNYLKSILIAKSKLIVNDQNEEVLTALFFGISVDKYTVMVNNANGGQFKYRASANILKQYELASTVTSNVVSFVEKALEELENLEKHPTSVYYTDKTDVYEPCVKYMRVVVKYTQKIVAGLVSDIQEVMSMNNGMMERTKMADTYLSQTGIQSKAGFRVNNNGVPDMSYDDAMKSTGARPVGARKVTTQIRNKSL